MDTDENPKVFSAFDLAVGGNNRRQLPNTEYQLTPVGLSTSTFGWKVSEQDAFQILETFTARGGNLLTVSDSNASGRAEWMLGRWISERGRRENLVIASRVAVSRVGEILTKQDLLEEALGSLERLQLEQVDILALPFWNAEQPFEEILAAAEELLNSGRAKYIASNGFSAEQLLGSRIASAQSGLPKFSVALNEYSLVRRSVFENEVLPVAKMQGLGIIGKHSLANGFLSGSFREDEKLRDMSRSKQIAEYTGKQGQKLLAALDALSEELGRSLAEISLAWLLRHPALSAVTVSALNSHQISQSMDSIDVHLNPAQLSLLDQASGAGGRLDL
ncbi:MAG: aldo/keto reductase [Microbacteriaceae bacterium]|nr:aldo/keto reductase [Microbacteriaceae bacterium]